MFHITSSLVGGLAAVTAWALVAPSFDPASKADGAGAASQSVNRTAKGDRLAPALVARRDNNTVATVEVVGIHDATIIYRDRDGHVLFQTDPVSNVTVISKGFVLPQLTVRETSRSTPVPIEAPRDLRKTPAIPIGCDPMASPISQPQLSRLTGRCLVQMEDARGARNG